MEAAAVGGWGFGAEIFEVKVFLELLLRIMGCSAIVAVWVCTTLVTEPLENLGDFFEGMSDPVGQYRVGAGDK